MQTSFFKLLFLLCLMFFCTTICRADGIPVVVAPNDYGNDPNYYLLSSGENCNFYNNVKYFAVWH